MTPFSINRIPRIVFEPGVAKDAGRKLNTIAGKNKKVLLVADPNLEPLGITERVRTSLESAGHSASVFSDIKSDPTESQIQNAIAVGKQFNSDSVVCLGGGSTMDAGKLIASLRRSANPVADYRLAAMPVPTDRPPIVCIPTTAGTGSEATSVCVVSDQIGTKYWFWGPELKSDLVLLDPELTVNLPAAITAASGIDAMVHAIEAETCTSRQDVNQMHTLETIRLGAKFLPRAVTTPDDLDARGRMLLCATYGGISIDNAGTGIAHNIAHALGSICPIHHGRAVAIAMAATFAWNIEGNADVHAPVAQAFGCESPDSLASDFTNFIRRLGITSDLATESKEATVDRLASKMAAPENQAMRKANVRPMQDEDLPILARMTLSFT